MLSYRSFKCVTLKLLWWTDACSRRKRRGDWESQRLFMQRTPRWWRSWTFAGRGSWNPTVITTSKFCFWMGRSCLVVSNVFTMMCKKIAIYSEKMPWKQPSVPQIFLFSGHSDCFFTCCVGPCFIVCFEWIVISLYLVRVLIMEYVLRKKDFYLFVIGTQMSVNQVRI